MASLFAGRGFDLDAMHARMQGLMDAEGLPYARRSHTYNSRLAQELAKWADSRPDGGLIHRVLYQAYFVSGLNIGDVDVLLRLVESGGLPRAEAEDVLRNRTHREAVDADWRLARQYGITGVPSFVAGKYKVSGAQPYPALSELIRAARG